MEFYGKKSCVSCKKAKALLDELGLAYDEHGIETDPPSSKLLDRLIDPANVKASLNTRSGIYKAKKLGQNLPDKKQAMALMAEDPNLIKRPVIMTDDGELIQGFDEDRLRALS